VTSILTKLQVSAGEVPVFESIFNVLMAELDLWYFFEGDDRYDMVSISSDKLVVDLQEEIHKNWNKSYCKDVAPGDLALLKVCYKNLFLFQQRPTFSFRWT
jgi:hypothetical protein